MSGANIQAPNLRAPRVSILTAAEVIDISGDAWWGGIEYLPLSAKGSGSLYEICTQDEKPLSPTLNGQRFTPFAVIASDNCSTFGSLAVDFADRARQKLAVQEPWQIERAIWEGSGIVGNPSFQTSTSESLGTGLNPLGGFALIDAAVASDPSDGRGMIHMNTEVFDLLQQYTLFRREGNVWFSPNDNIVLPGQGYPTDDYTIYGHSGIIQIVRSDVIILGDDRAQMNRLTNDIHVIAERVVGYIFANGGFESGDPDTVSGDPAFYSVGVDVELVPGGGSGAGSEASAYTVSTPVAADDADFDDATAYLGFSFKNNSATNPATVTVHNGDSNAGDILDVIELGPGESRSEWYSPGIATPGGIFVDVTAGALTANSTVRYRT